MHTFWHLCKQHLRHYRLTTAIWLAILAMMAYFVAEVAPSVVADNNLTKLLAQFPQAIRSLFGDPGVYRYPVDLYIQGKWLLFVPLLAGIFGVISAMGIMAREIDRRTADFVLTLPVRRSLILSARFAALAFNVGLLYLGSVVMLWLGLRQADITGAIGHYLLFFLGHYFLTLFFAALTLYVSLCLDDYAAANRYALIIVVGFYALYLIVKGVGASVWVSRLTLFGLVEAEQVVGRGYPPWLAVFVGGLLTLVFLWAAIGRMDKKQVPT
ncbi:MAG: ABC transporter permease [Bacteroidota bacterium]